MSAGQQSAARVGRYILEHRVASGGMGEVFSARAVGAAGTSKRVCIKRILASRKLSEGAVAHFISEAKLSMQLSHANVVPVFDFGRADDGYYLVMEWVDGVDLGVVLEASINQKTPFTVAEISYVGARLAHGLAHAHANAIIHRDVKPANLLLSRAGQIQLTDFGVAMLSGTDLPAAGTPAYMAPEQRWGFDVDARADVFAMGVTLFHLAVGKMSRNPDEVRRLAPEPLRDLLARMVAPLVEDRPADMEEVARELERMESLAVAGGAELPRVSLQRRVAELSLGTSAHVSLEVPFVTGMSLAAAPLTFTTEGGLAAGPLSDLNTPRLDATLAPVVDLGAPKPVADALEADTPIGLAMTLPAEDDLAKLEESSPAERSAPSMSSQQVSGASRAVRWGALLATLAAAGAVVYASRELPAAPSTPLDPGTSGSVVSASPSAPVPREADPPNPPPPATPVSPAVPAEPGEGGSASSASSRSERPRDTTRGEPRAEVGPTATEMATTTEVATTEALEPTETAAAAETPAQLHIGARPWAEVFVDGRRVGQTPISGLRLPPGMHQVRLVNGPLDAQRTIDVRLAPGETRYLREDMQ